MLPPPATGSSHRGGPPQPGAARRSAAFSLLEVLLATTLAGLLLAAAAALMVAVTDIWTSRQDRHFFEDHVDGVTEFLQASFTRAGSAITLETGASTDAPNTPDDPAPPSVDPGDGSPRIEAPADADGGRSEGGGESASLLSRAEDPIQWARPPGFASFRDPLLNFRLREAPPLLVQPDGAPLGTIESFLFFEEENGLSLLWYTPLQEETEDESDLRRTPISDLVSELAFVYWDEDFETWDLQNEPLEGDGPDEFILPRFLRLTFTYEGVELVRTVALPIPSRNALIF